MQVTIKQRIPLEAFVLDEAEVDAVKYMPVGDLVAAYRCNDPTLVPVDMDSGVRSRARSPAACRFKHCRITLIFRRQHSGRSRL